MVKFDGVINFEIWHCEVRNALLVQGLKDAIASEPKPAETTKKDWVRMNEVACAVIRSCLTQDIKYHVMNETSAKKIRDTLSDNYLTKSIENRLHLKRRLYRFTLQRGITVGEHLNSYAKLLADLLNVDVTIDDEDKALILLNSLPDDEYETFVLTLINGKVSLAYNDVTAALVNYELRKKEKQV